MNNSNNGLQAIDEKFLSVGDLFGLRFSEGVVFLEVDGWEQNVYSPYDEVGEIAGGDSSGWERLEDDGDDILYVEKKDEKVLHAGIGHSPSHVRRFTNYPEGENRLRTMPNLNTPRPGDDFGYVDGNESPYDRPTDAEELFIPPGVHLDFNFFNGDTETHEPIISIKLREYNVSAISPNTSQGRNAIRRVVAPGSPIPVANVGSIDRQANFDLADFWGTEPVSDSKIEEIKGGA